MNGLWGVGVELELTNGAALQTEPKEEREAATMVSSPEGNRRVAG